MSDESKVALLSKAGDAGYKTYLYFIFTDNVNLNVARVKLRAESGLHNVPEELIKSRYPRTFNLLPSALKFSQEAYIIDNSDESTIVAEKKNKKLAINKSASAFIKKYLK